ncbi:MAG: Lrp/AsnC family transcriptional regulator [Maritimibacter sp.]|jgi:Lrp/AsnC family leucine-responsive transcriptional regulator|uniref:Lrp/AsnC family transcriptional regulator n=1 Tax=Maritimibacter sp. TaxID=2003363 RepID=UPI001DFE0DE0|nr:Lrp/AsnC family transcriptional regulator [Maritimibacter sp.]MBL6430244.1 Lrp/AsnC family transcriptional regulator [Maritimibacter sp.]
MTSRPLDRLDSRILAILSEDGRISNANLAQAVGLSPSPCWQRVRRLEEEGVISGYRAIVDRAKLGSSEIVMIEVILDRHDDEVLESFGRAMQEMPEVLEVMLTTGEYDYLIKVAVSGTRAYEEFLRSKLYRVPGIRHSRSSFVLRSLKERQYDPSLQAG